MATKANIMKLLQEMRGFAELANRHSRSRLPGPLMLPLRSSSPRQAPPKRKRTLRVEMQELPDIPHPVRIVHRTEDPALVGDVSALI
jgi:hypothetical protein